MSKRNNHSKPELILFSRDAALLEKLQSFATGISYLRCEVGSGPEVTSAAQLDALWASPMAGLELFGAGPPLPLHEARVLPTPIAQRNRGFPRYGLVGVALSPGERHSPESNLRLVLSALLRAVQGFNSKGTDQINRVGIMPEDLELKKLDSEAGFRIIREIYEQAD